MIAAFKNQISNNSTLYNKYTLKNVNRLTSSASTVLKLVEMITGRPAAPGNPCKPVSPGEPSDPGYPLKPVSPGKPTGPCNIPQIMTLPTK